ncbi:unnamed protein product [Bemisia tabaci]|uniref:Protein kinase domain-containing protein n=1 Tax=Bemisia tabaci TaxID=7038 RepID=A0A9P0CB55_BEMTA|nr:unnamed protein product [Bemisia tabaci]
MMSGSRSSNDQDLRFPRESGEDSEDESEILEESPCGRWLKRREEVEQRDVPGIDCAYLAMDTEEGVEVVWNEVQFSERKNFKAQEEKIQSVFDSLTQLEHPNIVKFHRYWTDTHNDKPRVIFITEYMSSGSLKQFLKRTKRNVKKLPLQAWKRWCSQILSALSYLHSCSPPIIHGNLTCDTIFIQHNGLVKIGSVAPDAIHHHVKTCRENMKNMHFIAPEFGGKFQFQFAGSPKFSLGLESWHHFFPSFRSIENIEFRRSKLPRQESIILHVFKWRKKIVANFPELPLLETCAIFISCLI